MNPFDKLHLAIYGESHSPEIGGILCGLPAGESFRPEAVARLMERRKSGKYLFSTPRREEDAVVWSGVAERDGKLEIAGDIEAKIVNANIRPSDYSYAATPRPSHADFTAYAKWGKAGVKSGGGKFSGRMTAPLVALGAVAKELLAARGIAVEAYISELAGVKGRSFAEGVPTVEEVRECHDAPLPMLAQIGRATESARAAAEKGDSVGGIIECVVYSLPAGVGDAMFGGLESKISAAVYAVPAVKGVAFGAGFDIARMTGSEANDAFVMRDGEVRTLTNNSGGINGGVSNGMPVTVSVAIRPTPSISLPQRTVNLETGEECEIVVRGRHDATVVPRAVAAVESAVALAVLDEVLVREEEIVKTER